MMKINGKNFKDLKLWQKMLAILGVPAILAGVAGLLAFLALVITAAMAIAIPASIFKKLIKRGE